MKAKFWDIKNVITSFKGIATSIVTGLVIGVPAVLLRLLLVDKPGMLMIINILAILSYLLVWGFFATKFWGWK